MSYLTLSKLVLLGLAETPLFFKKELVKSLNWMKMNHEEPGELLDWVEENIKDGHEIVVENQLKRSNPLTKT
jgi:hypothetical protein